MAEPIIVCENLVAGYGRDLVLRGVSLEIPRGAFIPFVGPNGAGKTTLLRVILGLLRPRAGRVVTPFSRRPAGYVPQQKALDHLFPVTVRDIVTMGLYPKLGWLRRPSRQDRRTVEEAIDYVGLSDAAGKRFSELSGGMKQKALIARALASDAEVFVMDEPTSELDETSEREVLGHLQDLSSRRGRTVLIAYHGLNAVAGLATAVCSVERGRARLARAAECAADGGPHHA